MALKTRLTKQNCSARADTHSRCRMSGAAGTAAAVFLTLLLAAALFAGAGAALVEITDNDYPVSFWLEEDGKYTLNTTPTDVGDVKSIYGEKQVYKIRNATELEQASGTDIYILTEDIYFNKTRETAVIPTFSGVLIGNGHTIYNLTIYVPFGNYLGLVGNLSNGTLNYVQLNGADITPDYGLYVSGLAGRIADDKSGNITGCSVLHSDVIGHSYVGGLVGCIPTGSGNVTIAGCDVLNCSIVGRVVYFSYIFAGGDYFGGLVGHVGKLDFGTYVNVTRCNVANCSIGGGSNYVGGLVGQTLASGDVPEFTYCNVTNCIIFAKTQYIGGLIGDDGFGNFTNCTAANCTITATYYDQSGQVGGLVGRICDNGDNSIIKNSTVKDSAVAAYTGSSDCYVHAGAGEDKSSTFTVKGNKYDENVIVDNSTKSSGTPSFVAVHNGTGSTFAREIGATPTVFFTEKGADYYSYNSTAGQGAKYTILGKYNNMAGFGYVETAVPVYKVTFYNKTGDEYTNTSVLHGFLVTEPAGPVEKGYTFNGWNISSASGTPFDFTAPVTKLYDLYANRTPSTTVITLVNYTGGSDGSITLTYGSPAPAAIQTPEKGDLEFAGWYNETSGNNGTGTQFISKDGVFQSVPGYYTDEKWENETAAMNLYANWTVKTQPTPQPTQQPAKRPSSGGGSDKGTSVWLTAAPTQVPVNQTAEPTQPQPTVSLTQTPVQTPASPAPFAGILAGLGAAAVLFGIRRK